MKEFKVYADALRDMSKEDIINYSICGMGTACGVGMAASTLGVFIVWALGL